MTTKQKGNLTELKCITAFCELGYQCSIPYGENARYDFIADIDGELIRIQCKTSREKNPGVIEFSCRSVNCNTSSNSTRKYTEAEIDYFSTYWNNMCYLIPIQECSKDKLLRFAPAKNKQEKGVSYATNYELPKQILLIKKNN